MKFSVTLLMCISIVSISDAQERSIDQLDQKKLNWQNLDPVADGILGTSVDKTYKEMLKDNAPKKTVIVAVIDSGVDPDHEDLKGKIWINEDEIPGNGIDDDNNGYVDDIHGWNFLGNRNGENISFERMEATRLLDLGSGPFYDQAKKEYDSELDKRKKEKEDLDRFENIYFTAKRNIYEATGIVVTSAKDLERVSAHTERVEASKRFLTERYAMGFTEKILLKLRQQNDDFLLRHLNLDIEPRTIAGDDPLNINDGNYGNPDVKGPDAEHGTSVAGLIAAIRDNGIGINGIAVDVKIMCVRSTPNGDERDKDVALAIRYAVDNGADIINMSFGKDISPQKIFVDEAIRHAVEKDVLLIHAAGNDGVNSDNTGNYPSETYLDNSIASTMINIGASDQKKNSKAVASFSNYGAKHVHLFAPGVDIISTDTTNTYSMNDGTSLSAPVVSGVAALILSYYPDLTARDVIQILMESSYKLNQKVEQPSDGESEKHKKVKFSTLSVSGGIVNAYEAMKRAETFKIGDKNHAGGN